LAGSQWWPRGYCQVDDCLGKGGSFGAGRDVAGTTGREERNKKVDEMLSLLGQFRENQESTTAKVRAALGIASTVIPHTHTFSTISPRTYGSHQIRHGHIHCSNRR